MANMDPLFLIMEYNTPLGVYTDLGKAKAAVDEIRHQDWQDEKEMDDDGSMPVFEPAAWREVESNTYIRRLYISGDYEIMEFTPNKVYL